SVSSAVMAYGLSFVYGATGSTSLAAIARAPASPLLTLGLLAALAGLAFKIAAFPFHMWVPDAYEAGPTPFVAWLSVAPKAAGFGTAVILFCLVAYVFGNMGAFLVVEAVARSEGSEATSAFRGLAQRSPLLALAMLLFLLSLGGIPFVAGFWAKLYVFWAAAER